MRIWKYLVAMADLSIGLLGLFVVIFLVTKPSQENELLKQKNQQIQAKELQINKLNKELKQLKIQLSKAKSGSAIKDNELRSEISIHSNKSITVKVDQNSAEKFFPTIGGFEKWLKQHRLHQNILLKIDVNLPVQTMTRVIDVVKTFQGNVSVGIAVLEK